MSTDLRSFVIAHRVALLSGALVGIAASLATTQWLVNFAPFDNESSTAAWQVANTSDSDNRTPQTFYQPQLANLLQRLRVDGRFGGSAWQNLKEVVHSWMQIDPVACLNYLIESSALGLVDDSLLDVALQSATQGNIGAALATIQVVW